MKKILLATLLLTILFSGCVASDYLFSDVIEIPEEICNKINNKPVVILYQNNSESREIVDKMEILGDEYDTKFLFMDMNYVPEDMEQIELIAKGKPAVLIGCKVFVGLQTSDTYIEALNQIQ